VLFEFKLVSNMAEKGEGKRARGDEGDEEKKLERPLPPPSDKPSRHDEHHRRPTTPVLNGFASLVGGPPAKKRAKGVKVEPEGACPVQHMDVDEFMQRLSAAELDENRKLCECKHESHKVLDSHMCMKLWDVVPFCRYCIEHHRALYQTHRDGSTSPVSMASPSSPPPQDPGAQRVGSNWF